MKVEVIKNRETALIIDDVIKSIDENGIMAEGYIKAIEALEVYCQQTGLIRYRLNGQIISDSQINDELYRSPQNTIAFCGKRGTGKTSAMLSFADFLQNPDSRKRKEYLQGIRVLMLNPIDPTMLEQEQNILNVVFSRLLYKAEERWKHLTGFHHHYQHLESDKNRLLKKASDCFHELRAIKSKKEVDSLSELQRYGDSAVIKKDLYDLIDQVLVFSLPSESEYGFSTPTTDYLIIPIDDTDCQIRKAYEVMEDIRRYLTLPNVIILMATDVDMLRTVFAQRYADEFKLGINNGFLTGEDMRHYAEKYLTKMIPSTHRIYLPVFEEIIREKGMTLELGYYADEERDKDLISGSTKGKRRAIDAHFQSKVLSFIFRKTGIVFIEHSAYVNNLIPTTMRGLAHLLNYLSLMDKLEDIEKIMDLPQEEFITQYGEQLAIAEKNIDLFEEYFMNEWVPSKLPSDMIRILRGISEQVPANRITYAYDEIRKKYLSDWYKKDAGYKEGNYYSLMGMMSAVNGMAKDNKEISLFEIKKHLEDYYCTFAVRTLLTIKNNRNALAIKRKALKDYEKDTDNNGKKLVFDYFQAGDGNSFPEKDFYGSETEKYEETLKLGIDIYRQFLVKSFAKQKVTQKESILIQELAGIVLCNWDVQDAVLKATQEYKKSDGKKTAKGLFDSIQRRLAEKNDEMLKVFVHEFTNVRVRLPKKVNDFISKEGEKKKGKDNNINCKDIIEKIEDLLEQTDTKRTVFIFDQMMETLGYLKETLLTIKTSTEEDKDISQEITDALVEMYTQCENITSKLKKEESQITTDMNNKDTNGTIAEFRKWLNELKTKIEEIFPQ